MRIEGSWFFAVDPRAAREYVRQILWAGGGFALMTFFAGLSYTRFRHRSPYPYAAGIAVLLLTLLIGRQVRGTRAWLRGGILGVQPSEFCKITTILSLSAYLARIGRFIRERRRLAVAFGIVMLQTARILLQPDTGTAAVYLPIFLTMAFMTGARIRRLVFIVVKRDLPGRLPRRPPP